MIAENRHREDLDPLAEARAMSALIERHGWRQRRVAAEIGCSQAHVSKRMSLLQLPDRARDALADGKVSVETALELHKLTGAGVDVAHEAIAEAVGELVQGQHPNYALSRARDRVKRAVAAEETRKDLEERGTEIITEQRRAKFNWPMIYGDTTAHAEAGCLAAMISNWTGAAEYVCTNPASHPQEIPAHSRHEARAAEDEREGKKAARLRDIACAAIAGGPMPPARVLLQQITVAVLGLGGGHADSMRMAARWLAECGAAPKGADHYQLRDKMIAAGDHGGLQRYAYAYALAGDEARVRSRWNSWGAEHIAHFERLASAAGYEPTPWEQARLAEAQACLEATPDARLRGVRVHRRRPVPSPLRPRQRPASTRVRLGLHQAQGLPRPGRGTRSRQRASTERGPGGPRGRLNGRRSDPATEQGGTPRAAAGHQPCDTRESTRPV